jgi:hypothetical protein
MVTVIPRPDLNNIPTMADAAGYDEVKRFYQYLFVGFQTDSCTCRPLHDQTSGGKIAEGCGPAFRRGRGPAGS